MSGKIASIDPGSPAARARIHVGETLLSINGKTIKDVLDYRFYAYDPALTLVLRRPDGAERTVHIRKEDVYKRQNVIRSLVQSKKPQGVYLPAVSCALSSNVFYWLFP